MLCVKGVFHPRRNFARGATFSARLTKLNCFQLLWLHNFWRKMSLSAQNSTQWKSGLRESVPCSSYVASLGEDSSQDTCRSVCMVCGKHKLKGNRCYVLLRCREIKVFCHEHKHVTNALISNGYSRKFLQEVEKVRGKTEFHLQNNWSKRSLKM